ncbi:hybrid sensor histidine kinase/response regulator [Rhodoblastus sp.]|jgi:two-component system chemotaxis sensor kinase CheA|uniref:hybrid sensor histidine kinase/response regulator n=1 Tax=Rhodoblastus sp. TaxID=1962975 RepID=UPI00260EA1B3|nr:hybrid sensor histidine kinase/response regulator [Rhodoblastus sp.]
MDEMLQEFLTESAEQIEAASAQIVAFERHPEDESLIASIFRLVHTIKGTCGFLGLARLQRLTHAAESLIGALREGAKATPEVVSAILAAVDRIKALLAELEETGQEGDGDDSDMTDLLEVQVARCKGRGGEESHVAPVIVAETARPPIAAEAQPARHAAPSQGESAQGKRAETIRINLNTLERIMQLVSELVLTRNQLLEITRHREDDTIKPPLQRLSAMTSDLQDAVMRARMQPVERVFANLPRMIRDLATDLNKKINLVTAGGDTELDRQLIELIRDPLTHLVRNCADHGIESPDERVSLGKPTAGTIRVAASHEAGQITIEISDDGRGLNLARIKDKALKLGLTTEPQIERMTDEEICRFIFAPGFSTAEQVTNVSGRGVGMDVVRENIQAIGGSVALTSSPGKGSCFALKIPLTLAIAPALIVEANGQRFALPQHSVVEAVGLDGGEHRIEIVQGSKILQLREAVLPIGDLAELLELDRPPQPSDAAGQLAVIMRVGAHAFGITVDAVIDVQEIVVKPMGGSLQHLAAFSGHTILGDGTVVLILDPNGLREALGLEQAREAAAAQAEAARGTEADKMRLIYFRAGAGVDKVLPLSNVARIESVPSDRIERANGLMLTRHQGRLMPIVAAAPDVMVKDGDNTIFVISPGSEPFGLLVDGILDIVDDKLDIEIMGDAPGVVGVTHLNGKVIELVDIAYFVEMLRGPEADGTKCERRLLLVDDAAFFRDMLSATLLASGYEVVKAASAAQALAQVARNPRFDAVLIDVDLPDGAGYELAARLRGAGARAPALALAPFASREIVRAAAAAGMAGAVGKFQRNHLLGLIRACVGAGDDGRESFALASGAAA